MNPASNIPDDCPEFNMSEEDGPTVKHVGKKEMACVMLGIARETIDRERWPDAIQIIGTIATTGIATPKTTVRNVGGARLLALADWIEEHGSESIDARGADNADDAKAGSIVFVAMLRAIVKRWRTDG